MLKLVHAKFDLLEIALNLMHAINSRLKRRVRTSASIRFEATSIPFALHAIFPEVDQKWIGSIIDNIHTVGGLK